LAAGKSGQDMRKYDVAISVAVEDKEIAKSIVAELEKLKVRNYYYEVNKHISWGEDLIGLTMDAYGKHTRYVLLITSKIFVTKYWSDLEKQIALTKLQRGFILQLRLDDTPMDGISKHVVYEDWKNNPEEIAKLLYQKVRRRKRILQGRWLRISTVFSVLMITALLWGWLFWGEKPIVKRILIASANDTFYINSVEVTVAAYRAYCMHEHKVFPAQPVNSCDDGPVRNVTWQEARAYCEAKGGRLPEEMEWEYAALAGKNTIYSGGTSAGSVAVYHKVKPAKIGTKKPNAWQIYDMTGNVAEWCNNWADSTNTTKVVKGGGYDSSINPVNELAVSYRRAEKPDERLKDVGFRVVWNKKD
jgi:hypothetical protein